MATREISTKIRRKKRAGHPCPGGAAAAETATFKAKISRFGRSEEDARAAVLKAVFDEFERVRRGETPPTDCNGDCAAGTGTCTEILDDDIEAPPAPGVKKDIIVCHRAKQGGQQGFICEWDPTVAGGAGGTTLHSHCECVPS